MSDINDLEYCTSVKFEAKGSSLRSEHGATLTRMYIAISVLKKEIESNLIEIRQRTLFRHFFKVEFCVEVNNRN